MISSIFMFLWRTISRLFSFEQNHEHIDTQTLMDILIEASQEVAPKRTKRKAKHMNIWDDEIGMFSGVVYVSSSTMSSSIWTDGLFL
jgi:hypothetical protein